MTSTASNDFAPTASELAKAIVSDWSHLLDASMKKIGNCVGQLDDEQVWRRPQPSMNSIANLMLHLSGNLRQWGIVGVQAGTDDRDREAEFTADVGPTRAELLGQLSQTVKEAQRVIVELSAAELLEARKIQGFDVTVLEAIGHTVTHFTGHTHQIVMVARLMLGVDYGFEWSPDQPRGGVPA